MGFQRRGCSENDYFNRLLATAGRLRNLHHGSALAEFEHLIGGGGGESDRATLGESLADSRADDPVALFENEEMKYILAQAINTLPEREKIVVTLYYYEGLTLSEIGQVLGVTESRISQMHTKAVLQLRSKFSHANDG